MKSIPKTPGGALYNPPCIDASFGNRHIRLTIAGLWTAIGLVFGSGSQNASTSFPAQSSASLSGTVSDRAGTGPLADVKVFAEAKILTWNSIQYVQEQAQSSGDGSYAFQNLPATAKTEYQLRWEKAGYWNGYSSMFALPADRETKVDLQLDKILALSIQVREQGGTKPLAGAWISCLIENEGASELRTGALDQDGGIRFGNLHRGDVDVTIASKGYPTRVLRRSLQGVSFEDSLHVFLPREAVTPWVLQGRVFTPGGYPIKDTLRLQGPWEEADMVLFTPSDDSGRYSFTQIPPGFQDGQLMVRWGGKTIRLSGPETLFDWEVRPPILSTSKPWSSPGAPWKSGGVWNLLFPGNSGSFVDLLGRTRGTEK